MTLKTIRVTKRSSSRIKQPTKCLCNAGGFSVGIKSNFLISSVCGTVWSWLGLNSLHCIFKRSYSLHFININVVWKDKKQFAADLKPIYTAVNKDLAWTALEKLEDTWGKKYPHAIRSWKANWQELSHFFDFPLEIRTMIYTTNIIENLNGKIRKYTKTKMSFPDDAPY